MTFVKGDPQLSEISKKLDMLIRLSAITLIKGIKAQKEQIAALSFAGFQPKQIAEILGTTSNTVSVRLAEIRKEMRKKESPESSQTENEAAEIDTELRNMLVGKHES